MDTNDKYDSLLDETTDVQERVARGEIRIAQKIVAGLVEARFPTLAIEHVCCMT